MSDIGIKWTKGEDVDTATLKDLLIHSSYPLLKFKEIGTGSITYTNDGAGEDELVSFYDLAYEPLFAFLIQWYDIDAGVKRTTYRKAPFIDTLVGGAVFFDARPYIDAVNKELRLAVSSYDGNGGSIDLDFVYAIYYDPDADL